MYLWISEQAKEELDSRLANYENEIEQTTAIIEKKQDDYQKPFYKLSHWQAKLGYEHLVNSNIKKIESRKIFYGLKSDLFYGVNSLEVQSGIESMSIIYEPIYEQTKKCYKMYNRILTNLLSNPSLSDEMIKDYAQIAEEMRDFLNHISFRIPKDFEPAKYLKYEKINTIANFPSIYSITELALLKDWSYEEFIKTVKTFDYFRNSHQVERKHILEPDLSNIDEFTAKELAKIKLTFLNETLKLNEDISKQNEKLELVRKINNYLTK